MRSFALLLGILVLAGGAGLAHADEAVPPPPIEPFESGWKGRTSQKLPVYFGVRNHRVVNPRYHFRWGFCGVFGSHFKRAHLPIDPAGHWIVSDPRGSTFEGAFVAPDRVEGKVLVVGRELPGCPPVEATFVAWPRRR